LEIINSLAQAYAEKFSSQEDDLLHEIAVFANNHPHANMLSGQLQGRLLEMISLLQEPDRVLEIGTFMGYSALCLVKGLKKNGRLHTIELNKEDAATAEANFRKAGLLDRIILHTGNALSIIPTLKETWDLVFIDADKVNYPAYYKMVLPHVRRGGVILADNVLFHGLVLEKEIKDKNAAAIHAFNELILQDKSVEKVLLTVRDGLLLIRKK